MNKYEISIIIPTKNRARELIGCLESIDAQEVLPKEVIVVDQSEVPLREDFLNKSRKYEIEYFHNPNIKGASQARNLAINKATGSLIFFTDDDCVLTRETLSNIVKIFERDKDSKIGGVGALIIERKPPPVMILIFTNIFFLGPFGGQKDIFNFAHQAAQKKQKLLLRTRKLSGVCCYRKEVFTDLRFDESYFGYALGEDHILSYQVLRNYELCLSSEIKVFHLKKNPYWIIREQEQAMNVFWWFYFFKKYIPKTFLNYVCFLWLCVGLAGSALMALRLSKIKGTAYGFMSIFRVVFRRNNLQQELRLRSKNY